MIASNTLNTKEIFKICYTEQKISITKMSDTSIMMIYHDMSLTTVYHKNSGWTVPYKTFSRVQSVCEQPGKE